MLSVLVEGEMGIRKSPQPQVTFLLFLCRITHIKNMLPLPELLDRLSRQTPPTVPAERLSTPSPPSRNPPPLKDSGPGVTDPVPPKDTHPVFEWQQIMDRFRNIDPSVRDLIEQCQVKKTGPSQFFLKAPNAFFEKRIQEAIPTFLDALRSQMGMSLELTVSRETGNKESEPDSADSIARSHPMVREAATLFGGDVIAIRKSGFSAPSSGGEEKKT